MPKKKKKLTKEEKEQIKLEKRVKKSGFLPDSPDSRDYKFSDYLQAKGGKPGKPGGGGGGGTIPAEVDLRSQCSAIENQGSLGSCTAHAVNSNIEFLRPGADSERFQGSRLFIYYNTRLMWGEWATLTDRGGTLRNACKAVARYGVCDEPLWPYVISKFAQKPPEYAYTDAKTDKLHKYFSLNQTVKEMKSCLAEGYPFVFGFSVYSDFSSSGVINIPSPNAYSIGGHGVACVGYDDSNQRFICRNSWGTGWGFGGYFTMPYEYLTTPGLSRDFWTIRG